MKKKTSLLLLPILILVGAIFIISIYLQVSSVIKTHTSNTLSAFTTFGQNNPANWPRHYFKELGLSIKLPLQIKSVRSELTICKNKKTQCDSQFLAGITSEASPDTFYPFITADSEYAFLPDSTAIPEIISLPYDFYKKNDTYYFIPIPNVFILNSNSSTSPLTANQHKISEFKIHPLSITSHQGHDIIIFDAYCDYENGKMYKKTACTDNRTNYQVLIKLNNNKYFKIASLQIGLVMADKPSLKLIKDIVDSIEFDNP